MIFSGAGGRQDGVSQRTEGAARVGKTRDVELERHANAVLGRLGGHPALEVSAIGIGTLEESLIGEDGLVNDTLRVVSGHRGVAEFLLQSVSGYLSW
jgi:hypothetical protein